MPLYDANAIYDPILTNFSVGYSDQAYIGTQLFPVVPVNNPSGKYAVFDRSTWVVYDDHREPGAQATEIRGFKWSEDNFMCAEHAVQVSITDEERRTFANLGGQLFGAAPAALGAGINPDRDATILATQAILRRVELDTATLATDLSQYPTNNKVTLSGTSQWSDYSGTSDPLKDLELARRQIFSGIFEEPNLLIIPWIVLSWLRNHPKIVARTQYTSVTTGNALMDMLGFNGTVVVPTTVYNNAQNVDATESATAFWGKDVIMAKVDANAQQNTKTFAKLFSNVYDNGQVREVSRWRDPERWSDVVACKQMYTPKIVSNVAGYIIHNAVA